MHFISFLSGRFTTMVVIDPAEKKLAKRTSVHWIASVVLSALHMYWFLAVASWITWFISSWEKIALLKSRTNSQNDNYFHSELCFFKPDHIDWKKLIFSACNDNYCCLSLRYITWFMSQQPKFNTDVEQVSCWQLIQLSFERVLSIGYTD